MNFNTLLEYFEEAKGFKHIRDVICILCNATLEIRSLDGRVSCYPIKHFPEHKRIPKDFIALEHDCESGSTIAAGIQPAIIEKALLERRPQIFICASQAKSVLVPIAIRQEIVGFLCVTENRNFRLSDRQVSAIVNLIIDLIEKIDGELSRFSEVKGQKHTHQQKVVNKVAQYIEENYYQPELSLRGVSKVNGISYYYLSRLFKKELKTSFSQFLNNLRMDVATRLLKDQALTVSEIAYSCGFDDPGYFCKVFKRTFGSTPAGFRTTSKRLPAKRARS